MTSKHHVFAILGKGFVYDQTLIVFPFESLGPFALMTSGVHEAWARFFGPTLEDRLRYTPSDCFETFPLPPDGAATAALERVGQECHGHRAALMVRNNEGLTKTYNRFHDPDERDPDIVKLRDLHAAMDRAVLDAYGWTDIQPTCEFILDYEDDADDTDARPSRKKKPWRYCWPDEIRDEVLGRLLELNAQRAREEQLQDSRAEARPRRRTRSPASTPLLDS